MKEYKEKEEILDGRNPYSKTDTDATFMRMKEDHMKNGQLKEKGKTLKKPFEKQHLYYNEYDDFFVCPMGQGMEKQYDTSRTTTLGFKQKYSVYQANNCKNCLLRSLCHQSKENRKNYFNHELHRHKVKAKEKLTSEKGRKVVPSNLFDKVNLKIFKNQSFA